MTLDRWLTCAACGKRFRIGCPDLTPSRCLDCLIALDAQYPVAVVPRLPQPDENEGAE